MEWVLGYPVANWAAIRHAGQYLGDSSYIHVPAADLQEMLRVHARRTPQLRARDVQQSAQVNEPPERDR
jgi:hypothetical protein